MMTVELIRNVLGWCTVINYGLLLFWFVFFMLARDWIYRLHGRWFNISHQNFDAIHYAGMAIYKIGIFLLNLVPYIVLRFLI
jgi:hypothetical protein